MNGKHPESGQHWWPQGCDSSPICIYFYYFILRWWDLETFWSVTHNDSIYRKSGLRALVSQGQHSGTLFAVIHRCTSKGKRWVLFMRGWWGGGRWAGREGMRLPWGQLLEVLEGECGLCWNTANNLKTQAGTFDISKFLSPSSSPLLCRWIGFSGCFLPCKKAILHSLWIMGCDFCLMK